MSKYLNTQSMHPDIVKFFDNIREWLSTQYIAHPPFQQTSCHYEISKKTIPVASHKGKVILIQQFYIDKNASRHSENQYCLQMNVKNRHIDKIVLLNERKYTTAELGIDNAKINQIIVSERLSYSIAYKWGQDNHPEGYIVLANTDIFFDDSLDRIKLSNMHEKKKCFSLLRYEYNVQYKKNLNNCKIFGPRPDSQDVWIWHTHWKLTDKQLKIMNFNLGIPGCDNKIIYILHLLGFTCHNEPEWIRSYHYHTSQLRSYNASTIRISKPYYALFPIYKKTPIQHRYHTFNMEDENNNLRIYLEKNIEKNIPFIIPRIAGMEHVCAIYGDEVIRQTGKPFVNPSNMQMIIQTMQNNAGIKINSIDSLCLYSKLYIEAFELADRCFWWIPTGGVVAPWSECWDFLIRRFNYLKFDADILNIYHTIARDPWTRSLRGKRILIVAGFVDTIKKQIDIRSEIYGIDLFPECEFVFIKPPQTQGDNPSREFNIELKAFIDEIEKIKDTFDVALCSCGGYGNLVCAEIYKMGKSAIYVGGVLQIYFGVYGRRWLKETPDVLRLYLNKHWTRPNNNEKPQGFNKIENGCYW